MNSYNVTHACCILVRECALPTCHLESWFCHSTMPPTPHLAEIHKHTNVYMRAHGCELFFPNLLLQAPHTYQGHWLGTRQVQSDFPLAAMSAESKVRSCGL